MNVTHRSAPAALAILFAIAACNLPSSTPGSPDADSTAAAQTVQAQLTLDAAHTPTPTFTPPPTSTGVVAPITAVTATSNCDAAQFVADVTIPDGTIEAPSEAFTKTWRLKNVGTCSWTTSYAVAFSSGNQMNGPSSQALTGSVNPGQTVDISVNLNAPSLPGDYTGYWKLRNATGVQFLEFYVQIEVESSGGGGGGPFAVTGVTYDVGTFDEGGYYDDCPIVTAHITANGAGDVDYRWTRSDNASAPIQTVHFSSAGTKHVTQKWYLGSVWAGGSPEWLGIYIDDPNHQDFGHVNVAACNAP